MTKARAVRLHSALGDGALLFRRMTALDALGRPFKYDLDLLSEDDHIVLEDVLGSAMTVELELVDGSSRCFSGHVSHLRFAGIEGNYAKYRATLRPWLWLLTRTQDCRIFQEKSAPEIIKEIFAKYDASAFDDRTSDSYLTREYCVQYRESDYNFVSRLMEDEGIYYYFAHDRDRHTLVLADSYVSHDAAPGYETVPYFPPDDLARRDRDHLHDWEVALAVQPGGCALTSFDFTKPGADLMAKLHQPKAHAAAEGEIYDYPGPHCEVEHGKRAARIRLEERQARHKRVQGGGPVAGLGPGHLFTLANYPRDDQNIEYLVTQTVHEVRSDAYRSTNGGADEDEEICVVRLAAIPAAQPYRSPSVTPRPVVKGPQTAIVTGKAGEEIWTDQYGRVKVQFHWDREGKRDENSSCWVRVSQVWAGSGFGGIHIPRIGQEVIVDFLEGNPDRPFVSGRVYNAAAVVPYDLPTSATQSGIKSNSTKDGGGFNEFRFEDKKGGEQVYLHAQKNYTIDVQEAETETVGAGITTFAGGSIKRNAGQNIERTADKSIVDKAAENMVNETGKNMLLHSSGSYQLTTNLGIHMKAINLVGALIESGAKAAADALKKGYQQAAAHGLAQAGAGGDAASAVQQQLAASGAQMALALSPAIAAGAQAIRESASKQGEALGEACANVEQAGEKLANADSPEAAAGAIMEMIDAVPTDIAKALITRDLFSLIESFLPQIPSIELWAMKNINGTALWSIGLQAALRDVSIEAKKRNVDVKADKELRLEAAKKDLNIKASKTSIKITGKQKIDVKAEDDNLTIEAGKKKVFIKSPDQIFLKCGDASISMAKSGNIVIKGANINIKATQKLQAKGKPINLN